MKDNVFIDYLRGEGLSRNTIEVYDQSMSIYFSRYSEVTAETVSDYKEWLLAHKSVSTVNLRLNALRKYMEFIGVTDIRVKLIKTSMDMTLENIITLDDFTKLKNGLAADGDDVGLLMVTLLGVTGLRVSELCGLRSGNIHDGVVQVVGKGAKCRRVFVSKIMSDKLMELAQKDDGTIFINRRGRAFTPRAVEYRLYVYADRYGIDRKKMHPHSFRHFFAKMFLHRGGDLSLLAGLLGHENINTTRRYLLPTAEELRQQVTDIISW